MQSLKRLLLSRRLRLYIATSAFLANVAILTGVLVFIPLSATQVEAFMKLTAYLTVWFFGFLCFVFVLWKRRKEKKP